jgi:hypothetical protein
VQASQIDKATVSITVDKSGATSDVFIVTGVTDPFAHCHLTTGANKSGNGQTFGPAVKVTGVVDIVLGPSDSQDWSFNFLQFANLMVRSALWGGRTDKEGSVEINEAVPPAFTTNPSLDSTAQFDPFVNLLSSPQSQVPEGANSRITLTRVFGDHPNSKRPLQMSNITTSCNNFLYNMRLDVGFTTVFVGRDPSSVILPLAHFTWHLIYDAKFTWKGGTCTGTMVNGRCDVSAVANGAPPNLTPTVQTLLKTPKGPFYNDLCNQATRTMSKSQKPPNFVESATRDSRIPGSFFT